MNTNIHRSSARRVMIPSPDGETDCELHICQLASNVEYLRIAADWFLDEWDSPTQKTISELEQAIPKSPAHLAAVVNDELIGALTFKRHPYKDSPDPLWINALYIQRAWRGRGVGTALLCQAIQDVGRLGITKLYVYTNIPQYYRGKRLARHRLRSPKEIHVYLLV